MARSNGTAAAYAGASGLVVLMSLASCAAVESWNGFSGGAAPDPRDSGGVDSSLADARVTDAGDAASGDAGTAIAFVQVHAESPDNMQVSSLAVHYSDAQSAGDLNVVAVGWYDDATITTVTDTSGNTYRLAVGPTAIGGANPVAQAIYYASGIVAAAANANTVTVVWNKQTDSPDVRILEYRGLDRTAPFEVGATMGGTGPTATSGPLTPTVLPALLVGAGTTESSFSVAAPGFKLEIVTSGGAIAEDRVVTTAGPFSSDVPPQMPKTWVMQLAAFH